LDDPVQKIMFLGGYWVSAAGGRAAVEQIDGSVYLAISTRNVGSGIAVCQGWTVRFDPLGTANAYHSPLEDFRLQSRDLYIPSGDIGMWQGALRNPDDPRRACVIDAIEQRSPISVELLYSDLVGRERTISRFGLIPTKDTWIANLNRHWFLDWAGPRSDDLTQAAGEVILHDLEAADDARRAVESADVVGPGDEDPDHTDPG
jgi:hypothetical protein